MGLLSASRLFPRSLVGLETPLIYFRYFLVFNIILVQYYPGSYIIIHSMSLFQTVTGKAKPGSSAKRDQSWIDNDDEHESRIMITDHGNGLQTLTACANLLSLWKRPHTTRQTVKCHLNHLLVENLSDPMNSSSDQSKLLHKSRKTTLERKIGS